jgi:hypothetical protein
MPLPLQVASLIDDCSIPGGIVVRRRGAPTQDAYGDWQPAAETSITMDPAAVHNLTGRDLQQVVGFDTVTEGIRVYTHDRLYVADGGNATDIVEYQGRNWRIVQVLDYSIQGGVYVSTGTLVDVQGTAP